MSWNLRRETFAITECSVSLKTWISAAMVNAAAFRAFPLFAFSIRMAVGFVSTRITPAIDAYTRRTEEEEKYRNVQ
jgi:hypothetical protein